MEANQNWPLPVWEMTPVYRYAASFVVESLIVRFSDERLNEALIA